MDVLEREPVLLSDINDVPDDHLQKISAAKARIDALISAGEWSEAETACRELVKSLTAIGTLELQVALILHQLGFVLEAQGKHTEAASVREHTSELLLERADEQKGSAQ